MYSGVLSFSEPRILLWSSSMTLPSIMALYVSEIREFSSSGFRDVDSHLSKIVIQTKSIRVMSPSLVVGGMGQIQVATTCSALTNESSDIRQYGRTGSGEYHSDHSFEINPPAYTLLRVVRTPEFGMLCKFLLIFLSNLLPGGDTIFTSQTALYDKLSPTFQKTFEGLHAVHSSDVGFFYFLRHQSLLKSSC